MARVGKTKRGKGHAHGNADANERTHGNAHYPAGIEWEDDMVEVNRMTNPTNMRLEADRSPDGCRRCLYRLAIPCRRPRQDSSGQRNGFRPPNAPPVSHSRGRRFLVLSRDGVVESNLVWKDTVLIPTGQTVDILLDVTHAGVWMAQRRLSKLRGSRG